MRIVHVETVLACGAFAKSKEWRTIRGGLHASVQAVDWPPGSGKFTICPVKQGNGVKPIKNECIARLVKLGWKAEEPLAITSELKPGDLDAVFYTANGKAIAMEWETGNVSSSR